MREDGSIDASISISIDSHSIQHTYTLCSAFIHQSASASSLKKQRAMTLVLAGDPIDSISIAIVCRALDSQPPIHPTSLAIAYICRMHRSTEPPRPPSNQPPQGKGTALSSFSDSIDDRERRIRCWTEQPRSAPLAWSGKGSNRPESKGVSKHAHAQ